MIGQTAPQPDPAQTQTVSPTAPADAQVPAPDADAAEEFGGRDGLSPTRYGDWEKNGRCIDF